MAGVGWQIRPERPEDAARVDALGNDGFGPGRFAKTAYRLREGVGPVRELSFVATENGAILGSVRFWPAAVAGETVLLLGPLAVQSDQRGRGIGISLMEAGIREARARGFRAIVLVGDEPYYRRAGFTRIPPGRIRFPGPVDHERILGLALNEAGLADLEGEVRRHGIDQPVCADGAPVA
jgi:predicted N-acetyltransferase YhbS